MHDLTEMNPTEARHLRDVAEAWAAYGPALRAKLQMDGGMQWKSVNGGEYLCRYRPDPHTGKKRFTSLGRRSRETEATYQDFISRRDTARQTVLAGRDGIVLAGRLAKAYSLARLPTKTAEVLRALWRRSMDEHLTLFGGTALYAYELESGVLAPKALTREDHLSLVFAGQSRFTMLDEVVDAIEDAAGERPRVQEDDDRLLFSFGGAVGLELLGRRFFVDRAAGADQAEVLSEAFEMATVKGLTIARDAQPVEFAALDPRAYALLAGQLGDDDEIWAERAQFAATLVRERFADGFDPRQEEAFPEICLDHDDRPPRYGP